MLINGLQFEEVPIGYIKMYERRRRVLIILEEISTGEVHVSQNINGIVDGIRKIYKGHIGEEFKRRLGRDYLGKLRAWVAPQMELNFGGNELEIYLLARLANKDKARKRAGVQLREYARMTDIERRQWLYRYPLSIDFVLKGTVYEKDRFSR